MTKQMHLQIVPGDVGKYCILPGDPGRCEKIAKYFDNPQKIAQNREYTIFSGELAGKKVSVCSTGIGGPSAAIAVEELFACGVDTFIRIGTCGGINTRVRGGDVIVATGAVRQEGTTREYMPIEYPATSDFDVSLALRDAARGLGLNCHMGVIQSKDSFYGQHAPNRMPVGPELLHKWEAWKSGGVLASEMEAAAVFVVSAVLGARSGAILHVLWNQERAAEGLEDIHVMDTENAIRATIDAIKILIGLDGKKQ